MIVGAGFNVEMARKAAGSHINHIQERLKLVKGKLSIDSQLKRVTKRFYECRRVRTIEKSFSPFPPVAM
jgi:hypothetical protein